MLKLIFLLLLVFCSACKKGDQAIRLLYFEKGSKAEIVLSENDLNIVIRNVESLFLNTEDMLKLRVDSSTISGIISNASGVEFLFSKKHPFKSKEFGTFELNKLLLPFSGDFIGNEKSPVITIFPAANSYYSGPLRNPAGFVQVMEIRKIILKHLERE